MRVARFGFFGSATTASFSRAFAAKSHGGLPVLGGLAGRDKVVGVRTEDRLEDRPVEALSRRDQGIGGFLGGGERLLRGRGGRNRLALRRGAGGDDQRVRARGGAEQESERKRRERSMVDFMSLLLLIVVYLRRPPPPPDRLPLRDPALDAPLALLARALEPL